MSEESFHKTSYLINRAIQTLYEETGVKVCQVDVTWRSAQSTVVLQVMYMPNVDENLEPQNK